MNNRGLWQWVIRNEHGEHVSVREFLTESAARRDGLRVLRVLQKNNLLPNQDPSGTP